MRSIIWPPKLINFLKPPKRKTENHFSSRNSKSLRIFESSTFFQTKFWINNFFPSFVQFWFYVADSIKAMPVCLSVVHLFLVADTQLYKRLCPSIGPSVRPSVRRSVGPWPRVEKWENKRFRSFLCMCLCWKGGWVGRWLPLPTRPQRYCDPASLVHSVFW